MTNLTSKLVNNQKVSRKVIKCVVWDLDNTLWDGVLLEDSCVYVRENIVDIIKSLDSRGILQSIASKNEPARAIAKLEELSLKEYFLYPQINWNSKVASIQEISKLINIGINTIAFIDDQPFELEDVNFSLPEVMCINAANINRLLDMPEIQPCFITEDSKTRRLMYVSDIQRKKNEEEFVGSKEEFLATLNMQMTISSAKEEDLQRVEELTLRTNQLNTTGYTYSYEELNQFRQSDNHQLLIAGLNDKYGSYGKIGLSLIECQRNLWTIKILLMSCRVMSRGVGSIMLNHIIHMAKNQNASLQAEFVPNERNRFMYITYKFASFKGSIHFWQKHSNSK
ncbi:MAG: HAD-IIIC family phosphatase [Nostoc sp. EspVER01]|uniref:HAD-IIIC family phosphatase n=1 Tax=Nostoc sp. EspVER01 TaxID=3075408 RepID=UPI002AD39D54|nr:HAD-IIIC family phosphatase [Nostoc sp. EspVER01]MDZ7992534.1 HAD-IIIC family phosphatase [Nostoc sp. EspVER01]